MTQTQKPTPEEREEWIKQDAYDLAVLLYDIYQDNKEKEDGISI